MLFSPAVMRIWVVTPSLMLAIVTTGFTDPGVILAGTYTAQARKPKVSDHT
jgi:hypothetical protein